MVYIWSPLFLLLAVAPIYTEINLKDSDKLAELRQAERYILYILAMRDFHIYI